MLTIRWQFVIAGMILLSMLLTLVQLPRAVAAPTEREAETQVMHAVERLLDGRDDAQVPNLSGMVYEQRTRTLHIYRTEPVLDVASMRRTAPDITIREHAAPYTVQQLEEAALRVSREYAGQIHTVAVKPDGSGLRIGAIQSASEVAAAISEATG